MTALGFFIGESMLPFSTEDTTEQKLQWCLYQLKVMQKLYVQYARAVDCGNTERMSIICDLMYEYGRIISSDEFDFDLERFLTLHQIFDEMRDLK